MQKSIIKVKREDLEAAVIVITSLIGEFLKEEEVLPKDYLKTRANRLTQARLILNKYLKEPEVVYIK